jgi:hypothetical protein
MKEILLKYLRDHWKEMQASFLAVIASLSADNKLKYYWIVEAVMERM